MKKIKLKIYWNNREHYLGLMRFDKPIGTLLLAYPVMWALWLGAGGKPSSSIVVIFLFGSFLMRSAGCVINDYADRNVDLLVERTKLRPLTSGCVTANEALTLFVCLVGLSAGLLIFLPIASVKIAFIALVIASFYPFSKRFFLAPQLVLGLAFSTSIPMAYVATKGQMDTTAWLLFTANTIWTLMYDTWYALVDKNDDEGLGIYSTAMTFGRFVNKFIVTFMTVFLILMLIIGILNNLNIWFYLGLSLVTLCFIYQFQLAKSHERNSCFNAFLNNQWVGLFVFLGMLLGFTQ